MFYGSAMCKQVMYNLFFNNYLDRQTVITKCKFIIGISCIVIKLTSYLVVSEWKINIQLGNTLMNIF